MTSMSNKHGSGAVGDGAAAGDTQVTSDDDIELMELEDLKAYVKEIMAEKRAMNKEKEGRECVAEQSCKFSV